MTIDLTIKPLTPELTADYLDFFDNRAFRIITPWGRAIQGGKIVMRKEL